jgi:hypothetical protein
MPAFGEDRKEPPTPILGKSEMVSLSPEQTKNDAKKVKSRISCKERSSY